MASKGVVAGSPKGSSAAGIQEAGGTESASDRSRGGVDEEGRSGGKAPSCGNSGYASDITESQDGVEHTETANGRGGVGEEQALQGDQDDDGGGYDDEDDEYEEDDAMTVLDEDVAARSDISVADHVDDLLHDLGDSADGHDPDAEMLEATDGTDVEVVSGKASGVGRGKGRRGRRRRGEAGTRSEASRRGRSSLGSPCDFCDESFPSGELEEHVLRVHMPEFAAQLDPSSLGEASIVTGTSGTRGTKDGGKGTCLCPICGKPFPPNEIDRHANACLEAQLLREEEVEKKAQRAKRWAVFCLWPKASRGGPSVHAEHSSW